MWRQVLYAAICWLTLSGTFGEVNKNVISSIVDNESAESAPRLYRSVPVGVYASRSPYAAYSFQIPAFISAPKAAASRIIPVKQQIHEFHQNNGHLRDSYGNKFADTPQIASYKTAFPQQYVPLQELPAHLAQPLLAASQNKQTAPHYFVASQYRVPTFQIATNNARPTFSGFPQFSFSQDLRSLASPSNRQAQGHGVTTNQQQAVSNKVVYTNAPAAEQSNHQKIEPKFQRIEYRPEETYRSEQKTGVTEQSSGDAGQIEAAAAKTPVTAIVNGKKTVINIDTKPVIPLLDLSLLEPLTFDNPLVPQLQHFLPRIHDAKYHSLDEFNEASKKQKKSKSVTKKKPKQQSHHQKQVPVKPDISEIAKDTPELVYEISTPNHRETYKEKTISYNKKVEPEPETYSYNEKTEAKPVTYSYQNSEQKEPVTYNVVYSSNKKPEQLTKISHQGDHEQPRQLIYKFNADEAIEPNNHQESDGPSSAEDTGSAEVNEEDEPTHHQHDSHERRHHDSHERRHPETPRNYQHHNDHNHNDHHHKNHHNHDDIPHSDHRHSNNNHDDYHHNERHHNDHHQHERQQEETNRNERQNDDRHHNDHHNKDHRNHDHHHQNNERPEHREKEYYHSAEEEQRAPNKQYRSQDAGHPQARNHEYHAKPNHNHQGYRHNQKQEYHHEPNSEQHHKPNHEYNHKQSQKHRQKPEEYHHRPKEEIRHESEQHRGHEDSAPIRVPDAPTEILSHPQEHEEDIHLLPPHHNAPIKVDPNQHVQRPKSHQSPPPSPTPEYEEQPVFNSAPIIQEQGKRIIIQEESPEELHMHQEQITAEVIDQEDNNEEDFEKAYKNAAYGFPAFEKKTENIEKDIYNPDSYGYNRDNEEFSVAKSPFQQYQAEGDSFPRNSRLIYNKARDDTEKGYLLDYSINKPESVADRYRKKANYYKLYEKYKPEKYFASDNNKKSEKLRERYTAAPTFDFGHTDKPKSKGYFAQYKAEPIKYEYDYSKGTPRDNSAHASQPYRMLKSKTLFVEPQFQYGFDPISLPQLLDSELAAMASNHNPESEKPGMRKKIYEENWYIKKTSTAAGKPS